MRAFFLTFGPQLVLSIVIIEVLLLFSALTLGKKTLNYLTAAVCFGLSVDAAIIGLGNGIGEGAFLQIISQIRYILHGILVPLLLPIPFYAYGIRKKGAKIVLWIVTGIIIAAGIAMGCMIKTEPEYAAGLLRYASSDATPAFASTMERILSFGGVIPLFIVGLVHLIRNRSANILLAGIIMFAFSALAPATGNMDLIFLVTMIGEALMVLFFVLELVRKRRYR